MFACLCVCGRIIYSEALFTLLPVEKSSLGHTCVVPVSVSALKGWAAKLQPFRIMMLMHSRPPGDGRLVGGLLDLHERDASAPPMCGRGVLCSAKVFEVNI